MNAMVQEVPWRQRYGIVPPTGWTNADNEAFAEHLISFQKRPWDWVLTCYPWGEPGSPLERRVPEKWQRKLLMKMQEMLNDESIPPEQRLNRAIRLTVAAGNGCGKEIENNQLLMTPHGEVTMGSVQVGDQVLAVDGTPTTVTAVFPHTNEPLYRVHFSDGTSVLAGAPHLWEVKTAADRNRGKPARVLDTEEIRHTLARRYTIPMCAPAEFAEAEQPIDPYVLGYLLGNGGFRTQSAVRVACHDPELWEILGGKLPPECTIIGDDTYRHIRGVSAGLKDGNPVVTAIRELGLAGCGAGTKFIPRNYRIASVKQRLAILRGLMDSDGTICNRKGRSGYVAFFCTSSPQLRDDVMWLVRSLGGTTSYHADDRRGKIFVTQKKQGTTRLVSFQVRVNLPDELCPFILKRKAQRWDAWVASGTKQPPRRVIKAVTYERRGDATCITVDHPRALYLVEDFIVTHNTALTSWIIHWFESVFPHSEAVITAGTRDQLDGKTWRELAKWQQLAMNGWQFEWTATRYTHKDAPKTWFAEARAWSEANPQAMAGTHEKYVLVLFDEASAIAKIIWETVAGAMTTGLCFWLAFGNPSESEGGFWETHNGREASRWWPMRVDAREVSFANLVEINGWIEDYGEDSDFARIHVYGMFPKQSELQFIDGGRIQAATKRTISWRDIPRAIPRLMGVDIARQGSDSNVIVRRHGRRMEPEIDEWHSRDTMVTARHIADQINAWRPDLVFIDGVGIGAGVVDYLRMVGYQQVIVEVQAGAAPLDRVDQKRFKNMRAVMTWRMAEWLATASIPFHQRLMEELASYHKKHEIKTDRMLVESKQEMLKRGVRSPNIADALAHTFWQAIPQASTSKSGYADPNL